VTRTNRLMTDVATEADAAAAAVNDVRLTSTKITISNNETRKEFVNSTTVETRNGRYSKKTELERENIKQLKTKAIKSKTTTKN